MPEVKEQQKQQRQVDRKIKRRRWQVLTQLDDMLHTPMIILALLFVVLLVYSLVVPGPNPVARQAVAVIWYIFAAEFLLRALIAPNKIQFLKQNWLAAISLMLPALRTLQIFNVVSSAMAMGAFTGANSVVLLLLSSVHRGMRALRRLLKARGTYYVAATTAMVLMAGAAGMLSCENGVKASNGIHTYPQALYWTLMLLTTIGSDYWPQTASGKLLCIALSLYGMGILGYVAGTLASFFVGKDASDPHGDIASDKQLREVKAELEALRQEIAKRFPN